MDKHLHIVTHDVPWPVTHGGIVDLFYKLVALSSHGIKIHLHCFKTTDRKEEPELEKYCYSVNYYTRKTGIRNVSVTVPYIVYTRKSNALYKELKKDLYPVLLEGIHCTHLLQTDLIQNRKVFVRLHNVEYKYYQQLAKNEQGFFKKLYYQAESRLLKNYERSVALKATFLAVSDKDAGEYHSQFKAHVFVVPVFLPYNEVRAVRGRGSFCLYQGNLAVNENEKAVIWLLKNVFNNSETPFVIAGRAPSAKLKALVKSRTQTCMIIDPTEAEMQDLIAKAQINILPSFNTTGVKLKVLNALFNGKYCLVNSAAVNGSGIQDCVSIANSAAEFKMQIKILSENIFGEAEIKNREEILLKIYNTERNTERLIALIW